MTVLQLKNKGVVKMKTIYDNNKKSYDIEKAYHTNKYIVSYRKVYQPFYSQANNSYYAMEVYGGNEKLTLKGRFFHLTGSQVNRLIGIELLNEL